MRHHLVFDLDGTISDPSLGIWRSVNYALGSFGHDEVAREAVAELIGPPIDRTFMRLTGVDDTNHVHTLVAKFRERYADVGYAENELYPDMRGMLSALHARGEQLGLCTGKRVDFAERILKLFEIRELFVFVDGGDVGISKRDQLRGLVDRGELHSGCMIGDRDSDIDAGRSVGLTSIGVSWGFGSIEELADADVVLAEPSDLLVPR